MIRLGFAAALAACAAGSALAGDALPSGAAKPTTEAVNNAKCAAMGEGFFAVAGSDACVRISGHIRVGAGFGGGGNRSGGPPIGDASAYSSGSELTTSGDLRFDTPAGEGRVYVRVQNPAHRWLYNSQ
jgi:hypothetical protein